MIPNFPRPFKDELFYSLLARWQWLVRYSTSGALRTLFGRHNVRTLIEFPSHLLDFESHCGSGNRDAQSIIRCHTLLPIHAPFISAASVEKIEDSMRKNGHTGVLMRSGALRFGFRNPEKLRFCPRCADEERNKTGEAYWHRLHQIAGVLVCPIHGVFLQESTARPREGRKLHSAEATIAAGTAEELNISNPDHALFHRLAEDALWLLENWVPDKIVLLRNHYILLAAKRGYVGPCGSLLWKRILPDFQKQYPDTVLSALQCSIPIKPQKCRLLGHDVQKCQ